MQQNAQQKWLGRAYGASCALIASFVVYVFFEGLGGNALQRVLWFMTIAVPTIIVTTVLLEGLGAMWRRVSAQSDGAQK